LDKLIFIRKFSMAVCGHAFFVLVKIRNSSYKRIVSALLILEYRTLCLSQKEILKSNFVRLSVKKADLARHENCITLKSS